MALFKKKEKLLYAIANGRSVAIDEVPDEVFSTKMMGEGIAIIPSEGNVYAPCIGKVSVVMDHSKHAVGIENIDGMEVLIHVGLETVNLAGEGFQTHVCVGDHVEPGDLLITFDKELLNRKGLNTIIMLVVVEANNHVLTNFYCNQEVRSKTSPLIAYK